jgi:hypothetical protein
VLNTINYKLDGDKFIVEVDIPGWVYAERNAEAPFNITDVQAFKVFLQERINSGCIAEYYDSVGDEEIGLNMWEKLLDFIVEKAYEDGEKWLEEYDWEGEED